jgi:hypothetical protein
MIRTALLAAAACVSACAQSPQPVPHANGEIVTRAVEHAQAQVEQPRRRELRK